MRLVEDAGVEPIVGKLADAKTFDAGTKMYGKAHTARGLRRGSGIKPWVAVSDAASTIFPPRYSDRRAAASIRVNTCFIALTLAR